ncbi:MAG: transporter [Eubacteriales bacterium]|nr:transporter [Eubacteriales bacterium]
MDGSKARAFLALQLLLLCYALSTVMQKLAAQQEFLSLRFLLCAAGMFLFLGVYALGWQQVLKRLPLTVAYATSKAVVFLWMLVFGALIFHERVSPRQLLGCALLMAGVVLFALAEKEDGNET